MSEDTSPTSSGDRNLLGNSASSYLRSARHQPVEWHPWNDAAFALAEAEDKPILLDIGEWLDRNGEAIYATEPWIISGEGPTQVKAGFATDQDMKPYTS